MRSAITHSSSDVFPARSPMPLSVTSICRAPCCTAASELAVARPRSLWQCVDHTICLPRVSVFAIRYLRAPRGWEVEKNCAAELRAVAAAELRRKIAPKCAAHAKSDPYSSGTM